MGEPGTCDDGGHEIDKHHFVEFEELEGPGEEEEGSEEKEDVKAVLDNDSRNGGHTVYLLPTVTYSHLVR